MTDAPSPADKSAPTSAPRDEPAEPTPPGYTPDDLPPGAQPDGPGGIEGVGPISEGVGEDSGALDEYGRETGPREGAQP